MALLTISGEPATRFEDVAHGAAQLLGYRLVTGDRLGQLLTEEFGAAALPERVWRSAAASILARLATEHHLVVACDGAERLFPAMPMLLRAGVIAPADLRRADSGSRKERSTRSGRSVRPDDFDVVLNSERMDIGQMAEILRATASARRLTEQGFLSTAAEAELQFETRMDLARHRLVPARRAELKAPIFGHPSEEIFANLLDFYRIQWQYEPRSFALQWDKSGNVTEAFTPDFYLPEADLYVEITTMKQALVTRKNRKVKMLRAVYPHVNIQVFYQKDFQELVLKYGIRVQP